MERFYDEIMRAFEQPLVVRPTLEFAIYSKNVARLGAFYLKRIDERGPGVIEKMDALRSGAPLEAYHDSRVGVLFAHMATRIPLIDETFANATLNVVGYLHDIGKVEVPPEILKKNGRLTPRERAVMELHNGAGHAILIGLESLGFPRLAELQLAHHAYPPRDDTSDLALKLGGRVLQLCDQYDALASERPYRGPLPSSHVEELLKSSFPDLAHIVDRLLRAYPPPAGTASARVRPAAFSLQGSVD